MQNDMQGGLVLQNDSGGRRGIQQNVNTGDLDRALGYQFFTACFASHRMPKD